MERICKYYRLARTVRYLHDPLNGAPIPDYQTIGECTGAKMRPVCFCEGNESKCTYYPEKRKNNG